jgi:hypothetical protein
MPWPASGFTDFADGLRASAAMQRSPTPGPVILVILRPPAAAYATRSTSTLTRAISGTSAMFITVSVPLGTQ